MQIGKVPESVLKRSVLKQIHKRRPEVLLGAGVGEDCTAIQLAEDEMLIMSTDPITGTVDDIGKLATLITVNDLSSEGAEAIGIMLTVLLPANAKESELKKMMQQVEEECIKANIEVLGGHTEVTAAVNQPLLSVTGIGKVKKNGLIKTAGAKPGMDIIVTKWIGIEGTTILAKAKEEKLLETLPQHLIDTAKSFDQYLSVQKDASVAAKNHVAAMHDVTEGGIFGALWEMAEASGDIGLDVELRDIPIRQETVEITEVFGLNPYMLISSGSMLMAAEDGQGLKRALEQEGIPATIIGKFTDGHDRIIRNGDSSRYLEPPKTDELYKAM